MHRAVLTGSGKITHSRRNRTKSKMQGTGQMLSVIRQGQRLSRPVQQRHPQMFFQSAQLLTDGSMADIKRRARICDIAPFCEC